MEYDPDTTTGYLQGFELKGTEAIENEEEMYEEERDELARE